jgi:uncharacterized OsmC-like protein
MSTLISTTYLGDDQCQLTHGPTGAMLTTDLPPDNGGLGRTFSPTDLFASSLASCILTIMGKVAGRDGVELKGTTIKIEKIMQENPRRVKEFRLDIQFCSSVDDKYRAKLLKCIEACPVHKSLHPDIKIVIL